MKKIEIENIKLNNPCEAPKNSPASWCKKSGEASSSASADFLLEAEKRGSPHKSKKRQLLARRGSGAGGAALLRKEKNNNENAESTLDSAKSQNLKNGLPREQGSLAMTDFEGKSRGSIFDEKSGLCSHEQGNRTNSSLSNRAQRIPQIRARDKRAAFGMIFAVILTVIVAGLGILGLKFSTQSLNTTTNEYIAIQLDLYMNSTTEIAILYVQRNGFVCDEGIDCDLGPNNISGPGKPGVGKRVPKDPIEKYIEYGDSGEYKFTFKITPLDNYDKYDANEYMQIDDIVECEAQLGTNPTKRCFREDTKNIFLLDIAGSVTNPLTNQTLRVTKRQVIKP